MLIQNYGLFWKEEDVFWGRGPIAGNLLGVKSTNTIADPFDFREQAGVYVLYADYQMIYVGQAGNSNQKLFDCLKQHKRDALAGRWNQFSWFGTRKANKSGLSAEVDGAHSTHGKVLNHIEAILIHAAEPKHNRQGGRFGDKVDQYLQKRDDDNLGPTAEEMIHELYNNIK